LKTCYKKGIDRLVITDHSTIQGAQIAHQLDPETIIIGEEVMTQQGELLAVFVQEEIPHGLAAMDAIKLLRDQGAFISISHPFDVLRKGHWKPSALYEILPYIDAIETFNARCLRAAFNLKAKQFAQEYNIQATVGSDAHIQFEIGNATMRLVDFSDINSLKSALLSAQIDTRYSPGWVHLFSRYATFRKQLTPERFPS
jgi:predicted metal-dependent phosphoesterase TrpH